MAVRIHVTATKADEKSTRGVFTDLLGKTFDNVIIESTPPWNFFTTRAWSVDSSKLIEGLQRLESMGLQATTEDGSRWYLTLIRPGCLPQTFMHDFGIFQNSFDPKATVDPPEPEEIDPRLAFLEPDPEPAALRPWSQFDEVAQSWSEIGVPIAIDFRDRVQSMNYGKAVNEFRKYETDRLADALEEAGLKFNRKELLDALLWKSVTERELDADIGNLPRVLLALGLKGSIANFFKQDGDQEIPVDEAAGDPDDDGEYEEEDSGEFAEYDLEQEDGEDDWEDEYDGEDEISDEDQCEIEEAESRMQEMMQETERGRQKDKGPSKSDQSKEP